MVKGLLFISIQDTHITMLRPFTVTVLQILCPDLKWPLSSTESERFPKSVWCSHIPSTVSIHAAYHEIDIYCIPNFLNLDFDLHWHQMNFDLHQNQCCSSIQCNSWSCLVWEKYLCFQCQDVAFLKFSVLNHWWPSLSYDLQQRQQLF